MPSLGDLQQDFVRAVMTGDAPAMRFVGRIPPLQALAVHRDTVIGALVNALRISYPTVDALVGEEFFDQACCAFVEQNPPGAASLAGYGAGFADFLAGYTPAEGLAYLPDAARLDRAVETVSHAPLRLRRFVLDAAASIDLPHSLAVVRLDYPADEIRAALEDEAALGKIDLQAAERFVLVWRKGPAAAVQRVAPAAGRFLTSLLNMESAGAAFDAAMRGACEADVLRALQTDLFAAPYCTVISTSEELPP
jgi:hypothetical protein